MESVWAEIEQLREAPIAQVRARYREVFQEEPRSQHREHLFRRLAWRLQALSEGGLSEVARQRADESCTAVRLVCGPVPRLARQRERRFRRVTNLMQSVRDGALLG